jgi:hypothetical protein
MNSAGFRTPRTARASTSIAKSTGDTNTTIASTTTRVVRSLTGGTQQLTYADGRKETFVRKAGEVWISEPGPAYTNTNIGKTVITNYVVQLK